MTYDEEVRAKATATRRRNRELSDEGLAVELAMLIRAGHTTATARKVLKMGVIKAKRVRKVAVDKGLIYRQQRTRHTAAEIAEIIRRTQG